MVTLMKTILPIASGKGGVGKTILSANLGVCLARAGKTVVMVDLDLGGSNLHTCLGVRNNKAGLGNYIYRQEESLESLIVETSQRRLFLIPGDSLLPGTANLPYFRKLKIMKELDKLVADFVILDLGSGSAYNTVDFFLTSPSGLVVITPETTSILNAYSFIKTSLFRMVFRSFPPRSAERNLINDFSAGRIEGSDTSFANLIERLGHISEASGNTAREQSAAFAPRVVLNMGTTAQDIATGGKLREVARRNLDIEVEFIGFVRRDEMVSRSIQKRTPMAELQPDSAFTRSVDQIAGKLIAAPVPQTPVLFEENEDLTELAEQLADQHSS